MSDRDPLLEARDALLNGLPPDLARVLRDQSIIVPQDQAVFERISFEEILRWQNAQSDTPSAGTPAPHDRWTVRVCVTCGGGLTDEIHPSWPKCSCDNASRVEPRASDNAERVE